MVWFRFKNKREKEQDEKKKVLERLKTVDHDERREILRGITGQKYMIVKEDWDGKGNNKIIRQEEEEEPTQDSISTQYGEKYGGGRYIVKVYLPKLTVFNTIYLEGEPVLPSDVKKSKDPKDRLMDRILSGVDDATIRSITPSIVHQALNIPMGAMQPLNMNQNPFLAGQNEAMLKQAIAQKLYEEGKYAEAANVLGGKEIKNTKDKDSLDSLITTLEKVATLKEALGVTGNNGMSEDAQVIQAWGGVANQIAKGVEGVVTKAIDHLHGNDSEDEDGQNLLQCGSCGEQFPGPADKCPACGIWFKEPPRDLPPAPPQLGGGPPAPPANPNFWPEYEGWSKGAPPAVAPIPDAPPAPAPAQAPSPAPAPMPTIIDMSPAPKAPETPEEPEGWVDAETEDDEPLPDAPPADTSTPAQVQAPVPTPASAPAPVKLKKVAKMSFSKKWLLVNGIPKVFLNRIKRHNGEKAGFPPFVKLARMPTSRAGCAPGPSAQWDFDLLMGRYEKGKVKLADVQEAHEGAVLGFDGMAGKFGDLINGQHQKYSTAAVEMMQMGGPGPYRAKYPAVTDKDIKELRQYITLREVWDYMNTAPAQAWWKGYCTAMRTLIEAKFPAMKGESA